MTTTRSSAKDVGSGPPAACIRERNHLAALDARGFQQVRVRGRKSLAEKAGGREGQAVGHRDRPRRAIVVARVQLPGEQTCPPVDGDHLKAPDFEPAELLGDRRQVKAPVARQDVEHLAEVHRTDTGRVGPVPEESLDLRRGWLADEDRDDRLRVEDAQARPCRGSSALASSARTMDRISVLLGPEPARDPTAAAMGSAGIGRRTRASP